MQAKERYLEEGGNISEKVANFLLSEAKTLRTKDNTSILFLEFDRKFRISCKVDSWYKSQVLVYIYKNFPSFSSFELLSPSIRCFPSDGCMHKDNMFSKITGSRLEVGVQQTSMPVSWLTGNKFTVTKSRPKLTRVNYMDPIYCGVGAMLEVVVF